VASAEDLKNAAGIGAFYTHGVKHATLTYASTAPIKNSTYQHVTVRTVLGGTATTLSAGKMKIFIEYLISE
jgi:hypothetical protein